MTTARRTATLGSHWLGEGRRVAAALLVGVDGSAPLQPGATMLISAEGEIDGSITGGCVEAAVAAEAQALLADGGAPKTLTYGISDELAGTVGLACGGVVHVFLQELSGAAGEVEIEALKAVGEGRPVAIATAIDGSEAGARLALVDGVAAGTVGGPELLDHSVARDAAGMLAQGITGIRRYGTDGATLGAERSVHVRSFAAAPTMLIVGAIDFSVALARLASELGYAVTIGDPRAAFLRSPQFAEAADVQIAWPQDLISSQERGPRDVVLVFTHDPKFDVPAVRSALATEAGYIGALGSRRTTADRNRRLREEGVCDAELARVHAPCGLDIGGSTPEEVAISVLAEIIAVRTGRSGAVLREGSEPIHPRRAR